MKGLWREIKLSGQVNEKKNVQMDREVDEKQIFRLKKEYGQRQTGTIDKHIILKANRNKKT